MHVFDVLSIPELTKIPVLVEALPPAAVESVDYLQLVQNDQQDERAMPVPKEPESEASPGPPNVNPLLAAGNTSSRSVHIGATGGSHYLPNTRYQTSAAFGFKGTVNPLGSNNTAYRVIMQGTAYLFCACNGMRTYKGVPAQAHTACMHPMWDQQQGSGWYSRSKKNSNSRTGSFTLHAADIPVRAPLSNTHAALPAKASQASSRQATCR
jgi:hypothetical protein